ncbi:3-hydroxyacyl-CoA dehydrogenase family protein [Tsukamurella asaccharolytica]|uniref:3-hydroxyacyl-CoA dehydrogenase family protein n=1 Tax=Tsukamurella asaccharolytica TaxID=2592067 RepID=A0A5C5RAR8_9ACTN|nr:3-hydroxyacyl-CoA dehydrogenase family protein [Tsukamurella asaccharolytica]TWS19806.1 3-hydroxyacyl-CoA dehydrogenase family protein [Tsukamurella asaccharolytica]
MTTTFTFDDIRRRPVAVIGAGTLGRRIALMFASRGGEVRIHDSNADQARAAVDFVTSSLPGLLDQRGSGEAGTATAHDDLSAALDGAWLVVEAVPERLDIKIPLWGEIDSAAPSDAILTTNSSSYASRLMSERISDRTRFCNLHFYMPPISNAADVMSDGETSRAVLDTLLEVLPEFDVHPFEARRESTGFIFNRVWAAIKRESLAVVAEGVARPEDVDGMFRINWHLPAGPFQMMDNVGLDVVLDIEDHYAAENPHLPEGPRRLLHEYVDAGKLGVKTGEGFYRYPPTTAS